MVVHTFNASTQKVQVGQFLNNNFQNSQCFVDRPCHKKKNLNFKYNVKKITPQCGRHQGYKSDYDEISL